MSMPTVVVEAAFGVIPSVVPDQGMKTTGAVLSGAETPDDPAFQITGDLDLRWFGAPPTWVESTARLLVGHRDDVGGDNMYGLHLLDGFLLFERVVGDPPFHKSTVPIEWPDGGLLGVRATIRRSDGRVQFFTSTDDGATWIQLGGDITVFDTPTATAGPLAVSEIPGTTRRAEVRDGIDGTIVASPDFSSTGDGWQIGDDNGTPARNDAQGNPWTLEGGTTEIVSEWVDLTDRVGYPGGISWRYGRDNERESPDAGTGSVVFDNADRALDPTNQASPFWPFVRPMTRIRVRATHLTVTYPVLEAFVESWPPRWAGDNHAFVTCQLVDGFKLLAQARTSVGYVQAPSGTRIRALLDAADWPTEKRTIDAGQSEVQVYTASDRIVLNAIRDTAKTESGVFFIDPAGNAVFRDRLSRIVAESQVTLDELSATLPYEDIHLSFDEAIVWNDIAVKPEGLTVQRAEDDVSQAAFGHRQLPEFGGLVVTELEASDLAHWTLRRYKNARLRVDAIDLAGDLFPAVMTQILAREVGDRVTVEGTPPGGGAVISEEVFIEHVSHNIGATSWRTTWQLSPAFAEVVWLAGLEGFSEAGETTFAGY